MMVSDFTMQFGTQDPFIVSEVIGCNEYQLPDRFMPGDVVVDVGAHIGCFAVMCLFRGARVHCYEPNPGNFKLLMRNTQSYWLYTKLYELALWKKGVQQVSMMDMRGYTACHYVDCAGEDGKTFPANSTDLDSIIRDAGQEIRLLKLDCEGGEWPGLYESNDIRRVKEIIAELHTNPPVPGFDCTTEAMTAHLESRGFDVKQAPSRLPGNERCTYLRATRRD